MRRFLILLLFALPARCQTVQVTAGSSTLLRGSGAGFSLYTPNNTYSGSIGYSNGHVVYGGSDEFEIRGCEVTVGDKAFGFSFDGAGLGLQTTGVSIQHRSQDQTIAAFAGMTGLGYTTPFITTARAQHVGAGFFYQRRFSNAIQFSSLEVIDGGRRTAVEGIRYERSRVAVSSSGGLLQGKKYFDAFILARPVKFLGLSASHESLVLGTVSGSTDSGGASASLGRLTLSASVVRGGLLRSVTGKTASASLRLGPVNAQSGWYSSGGRAFLSHSIMENVRHWNFTQSLTQSNGRNAWAFGGGYSSNRVSVNVGHSIVFLLNGKGYQQVLGLTVSFRVRDIAANVSTVTDSVTGKTKWGVYGTDYVQTGLQMSGSSGTTVKGYEVKGRVVDERGEGVEGAAVRVGKATVFTDSEGHFMQRQKKSKPAPLAVDLEAFVAPGEWECVSCPASATPGDQIQIVVRRKT